MYKKILHATDFESNHFNYCQQAKTIAEKFGAELYIMHVITIPTSLFIAQSLGFAEMVSPLKDNALTVMQQISESLNIPSSHQFVELGNIKHEVFKKIEELDIDLLIIGNHAASNIPAFVGSNVFTLMQHTPCDVLTLM